MKTDWDFSDLKSDAKEQETIEKNIDEFAGTWKKKDFSNLSKEEILSSLKDYEKIMREHGTSGRRGYESYLKIFQNENDPEIKKEYGKLLDFENKMLNKLSFYRISLAKIPEEAQKQLLESSEFANYNNFLAKKFAVSKYLLSEEEEKILTLKDSVAYDNWVKMLSGFLSKEERYLESEKENKTFSEIMDLLSDTSKEKRDCANEAFNDILEKNSDLAEVEINSVLKDKAINDELRGFERADQSRLIADDIDSKTVDELLRTITSRFDIAKRYYKLKAKLFGVEKLGYHERNVPYGSVDKKMSYEKALEFVLEIFQSIDPEFKTIIQELVDSGKIDVFPKKNKRMGAACFHNIISHPTYILLNYQENLKNISTMAHEFGHAIHNALMKDLGALNFGCPKSTAEVASTFFEDFVLEKISENASEEERLAILMQKINEDVSSIARQAACYNFEKELHEIFRKEGYLSKETIGGLFQKHMSSYMGPSIDKSKGSENWWVYWSHIREYFYVYSYASGVLISKALQEKYKEDKASIEKFKQILAKGTSKKPETIFQESGLKLDKDLWDKGLDKIEEMLDEAEALAKKLGKI